MTPVLDSVDAISCTCEKVLSEMTKEPITGEHYNILEVENMNRLFKTQLHLKIYHNRIITKSTFIKINVEINPSLLICLRIFYGFWETININYHCNTIIELLNYTVRSLLTVFSFYVSKVEKMFLLRDMSRT